MIRRNQDDDDDDEWDKIEDDEYPLSSDGENDEFDRAYVVFDHFTQILRTTLYHSRVSLYT